MRHPKLRPLPSESSQVPTDSSGSKRAHHSSAGQNGENPESARGTESIFTGGMLRRGMRRPKPHVYKTPGKTKTGEPGQKSPRKSATNGNPAGRNENTSNSDSFSSTAKPSQPSLTAPPGTTPLSRILILAAVGLAVFLMVFPSLKSWTVQQRQARELAAQITQAKNKNQQLEEEISRYQDQDYITRQARERLGYVKPGETTYVVVDPPNQRQPRLRGGWIKKDSNDLPWFSLLLEGIKVAGTGKTVPAKPSPPRQANPTPQKHSLTKTLTNSR